MEGEILFLVHRIPFPPDRGDKIRSFHLLKALRAIAPVHLGCFADDARDMGFASDLAALTESRCVVPRARSKLLAGLDGLLERKPMLVALYESARLRSWVAKTLRERPIRAIVAFSVQMADFAPRNMPPGVRFIMDFVDFDSAKYAAYGAGQGGAMGWINRREGRRLLDFEREVARLADVSSFVSAAEAAAFAYASGCDCQNLSVLENGVDLNYFNPQSDIAKIDCKHPLVVFTGQMDYRPNVEAVVSFIGSFSAIRSVHPDATFAIVGRNPAREVRDLAAIPGVIVTGGVPDVRGWLAAADVVVAPLRIARGVQNKVLEAMAMARPVVASAEAAEGIDARHGEHLIVVGGPDQESNAVLALLADPARAVALGQAARARVEARYDWPTTLTALRAMLTGTVS